MTSLILGTAEFNPAGYANIAPLEDAEKRRILGLARECGINMIDTAESYNSGEFIKNNAKGFCIYTKTRDWKVQLDWGPNELRGILYHYQPTENPIQLPFIHRWVNLGVSVYDQAQIPDERRILQIPYNIEMPEFERCFTTHRNVFVRSVFGRGTLLETHTLADCLADVLKHRPDGIIVGVKSARELEDIILAWESLHEKQG